jgi:hypothetical protein
MADRAQRRAYRVVFTPGGQTVPGRRGVIVVRDEQTAHQEARTISQAGGYAEVLHVDDGGSRQVLAVYHPEGEPVIPS